MIETNIHNYREKLGKAIRRERRLREMSQEALGEQTGISTRTINNIESSNYTKDIKLVNIQNICSLLNLEVIMKLGDIKD